VIAVGDGGVPEDAEENVDAEVREDAEVNLGAEAHVADRVPQVDEVDPEDPGAAEFQVARAHADLPDVRVNVEERDLPEFKVFPDLPDPEAAQAQPAEQVQEEEQDHLVPEVAQGVPAQ